MSIIALFSGQIASAWRGGDPMISHKSFLVSNVVKTNGWLDVDISTRVSRACEWTTTRYWYDGPKIIARSTQPAPVMRVTDQPLHAVSRIKLPPDLGPGHYRFVGVIHADCGHGDVFSYDGLDAEFTVAN